MEEGEFAPYSCVNTDPTAYNSKEDMCTPEILHHTSSVFPL